MAIDLGRAVNIFPDRFHPQHPPACQSNPLGYASNRMRWDMLNLSHDMWIKNGNQDSTLNAIRREMMCYGSAGTVR